MFIFLPHDLSVAWCEYDRPDYTALIYNNNNRVPSTLLPEVQVPIFITALFFKTIEGVFCFSHYTFSLHNQLEKLEAAKAA